MSVHDDLNHVQAKIDALHVRLNELLDTCPDGECWDCSRIVCPHGSGLHFHHDGCPACAEHEEQP